MKISWKIPISAIELLIRGGMVRRASALRRLLGALWKSGRGAKWHAHASCPSWKPARPADIIDAFTIVNFLP